MINGIRAGELGLEKRLEKLKAAFELPFFVGMPNRMAESDVVDTWFYRKKELY